MTTAQRILKTGDENRIEFEGQIYGEDELHEVIWLAGRELRCGLPKRERREAQNQIAQYEELLTALRSAGA